jgi:hypothetical protein
MNRATSREARRSTLREAARGSPRAALAHHLLRRRPCPNRWTELPITLDKLLGAAPT